MIDNGVLWDEVWLFGSPLVNQLNMIPEDEVTIGGAGEEDPTTSYVSSNLELRFDQIVFYEQPTLVSPPEAGFAKMFPGVDGQLCNTFFKHFIVEFDFVDNRIILYDPKRYSFSGNGSIIEMRENTSGTYSIPFEFELAKGETYKDRVDIDFGGIYALKVALNNYHNIQLPEQYEVDSSYGAQGKMTVYHSVIESLTFGDYTFNNVVAYFGDEQTSRIHPGNLGVVGLPLFMKFDIAFDYFNNRIYIKPNDYFDMPVDWLK